MLLLRYSTIFSTYGHGTGIQIGYYLSMHDLDPVVDADPNGVE